MTTRTAWRACHPDLRSSNGYRWPWPGNEATAPLPDGREFTRGDPCPQFIGDGLCLAKTWRGAASGAIPAITCLLVEFDQADVLGEDDDKVRVSRCRVVDVFDGSALIRDGWCQGADLGGADLRYANLWGANLRGADLRYANLGGVDLRYTDLRGANLRGAFANKFTRWPDGFDPAARGVTFTDEAARQEFLKCIAEAEVDRLRAENAALTAIADAATHWLDHWEDVHEDEDDCSFCLGARVGLNEAIRDAFAALDADV